MKKDKIPEMIASAEASTSFLRQVVQFFLHLAALYITVYICSPWLAGTVYNLLLPGLGVLRTGSSFQFFFSHLFAFSFIPAFISGLLNTRYRHAVAMLVWIFPAAVLAYKLATFPAGVFENPLRAAIHHYFSSGFLIPEFRDYRELFAYVAPNLDARRGMDQLRFTAPVYAGISYSLAAWISRLGLLPKLFRFEKAEE